MQPIQQRYLGVHPNFSGTFQARIMVDGVRTHLGNHATPQLAARAYDTEAVKHGRPLNFPQTSGLRDRQTVVAEALGWLGTPYHHLADVKGQGVDCAMFLVRVFVDTGMVPAFDPRPYPTDWHLHRGEERYLGAVLDQAREVDRPGPGDIALYRFGRTLSHSALVIAWPRVIHAQARVGCILADAGRDEPLASRTPRFFSLFPSESETV